MVEELIIEYLAGDVDFECLLASRSQVVEFPDDCHHTCSQEDKEVEVHEHEIDKSVDTVRLLGDGIRAIGYPDWGGGTL